MTPTGHRPPKFAVLHNAVPMNAVVGCDPQSEGAHETARVHHPARRRGGVPARGASAAGRARSAYWRDTLAPGCLACYTIFIKILSSLGAFSEQLAPGSEHGRQPPQR